MTEHGKLKLEENQILQNITEVFSEILQIKGHFDLGIQEKHAGLY